MIRRPVHSRVRPRTLLVLAVLVLTSCQTAYYAAMEKLGYPKRDLLASRVQQARDSQQAAKEQFQSALERFRTVINFRGGELEAKYNESVFENSHLHVRNTSMAHADPLAPTPLFFYHPRRGSTLLHPEQP